MRWIAAMMLCLGLSLRAGAPIAQELELAVLGRAEALMRAGQAGEAWDLLAPLERQYAGRPDFDYLLGTAALESGRPNRATFIFERVITENPGHLAARLEMARAYFALRDLERAEREFNFILANKPSEEIASLSRLYLARMREAAPATGAGLGGYVEAALGHDSNVSAAAALSSVFVPALGTAFVPDPQLMRRRDDFLALGAGLEYARALGADWGVAAAVDLRQRWHPHADAFDARTADLQGSLTQRLDERSSLHYSVRHNGYELDHARYRDTESLGVQWTRRLGLSTRITAGGEGHRIRYRPDDVKASSSDLYAASAGIVHVLEPTNLTTASASLYLGSDQAAAGRADGDRRIVGASLGLQRRLLDRVEGQLRFSLLDSAYRTENADFGVTRRDRQLDVALGVGWELARGWLLRPQVIRTSHRSNLPLNEYRRTETSITLRRTWD